MHRAALLVLAVAGRCGGAPTHGLTVDERLVQPDSRAPHGDAGPAWPSDAAPDGPAPATVPPQAGPEASPPAVEAPLEKNTTEELLQIAGLPSTPFTREAFALAPGRFNDGNPALAHHAISRQACLDGLRGVTLQTDEQRRTCGAANMVPIWTGKDPSAAKACIDVFEFPNAPCELPVVWGTPAEAERVCEVEGKRLCTQDEWNLACRGDPAGGKDRTYAYGDSLDYDICNTNKPHPMGELTPWGKQYWKCTVVTAEGTWRSCSTDTEPSGSFPRCRSRFGVFDQHGNVAEMMTRKEGDTVYTQLKGSPFFYVDVGRPANAPPGDKVSGGQPRDTYPDSCNFDPRWHVEELSKATHSNYHLGFRCCKTVK